MTRIAPAALALLLALSAAAEEEFIQIGTTVSVSSGAGLCISSRAAEDYYAHVIAGQWNDVRELFSRKLCRQHDGTVRGTVLEKYVTRAPFAAWYRIRFDLGEEQPSEFFVIGGALWVRPEPTSQALPD